MPMSPAPIKRGSRRNRSRETFVIVGAGQAGTQAAQVLRERGFAGHIVLLGDEAQAPYQRPPLSKTFLASSLSVEPRLMKPRRRS